MFILIHFIHKEGPFETIFQISFKQLISFDAFKDRMPSPPFSFDLQTSSHEIFAFFRFRDVPDHRKAEQRLSISWMHFLGRRKAFNRKLAMFLRTEVIRFNLPAKDRKRDVNDSILFLIYSNKGLKSPGLSRWVSRGGLDISPVANPKRRGNGWSILVALEDWLLLGT